MNNLSYAVIFYEKIVALNLVLNIRICSSNLTKSTLRHLFPNYILNDN